jgi:cysteine synthase A
MARRRALEFGRTEIPITSAPLEDKDILVTSTAAPSLTASSNGPSKSGHRVRFTPSIDLKTGYGVAALNALDSLVPTPSDVKNIIDAELQPRGFFADQFENQSNFDAHYQGTGPEILKQVNGQLDAFVSGAGTGGTISGIGRYLKKHVPDVKVVLSDPEGMSARWPYGSRWRC